MYERKSHVKVNFGAQGTHEECLAISARNVATAVETIFDKMDGRAGKDPFINFYFYEPGAAGKAISPLYYLVDRGNVILFDDLVSGTTMHSMATEFQMPQKIQRLKAENLPALWQHPGFSGDWRIFGCPRFPTPKDFVILDRQSSGQKIIYQPAGF